MRRRTLLSLVGAGAPLLADCTTGPGTGDADGSPGERTDAMGGGVTHTGTDTTDARGMPTDLEATAAEVPDGADPVPVDEIEDETVDRYVDLLASLSGEFDRLSERGDSDSLYVDVDGTTVELSATATDFHGGYWWESAYYVDERVVRRSDDEDADPRTGTLLDCRRLGRSAAPDVPDRRAIS